MRSRNELGGMEVSLAHLVQFHGEPVVGNEPRILLPFLPCRYGPPSLCKGGGDGSRNNWGDLVISGRQCSNARSNQRSGGVIAGRFDIGSGERM